DGYVASFHEILSDERIVFTYDLDFGGPLVSVSLATVEFHATGDGGEGTHLTYTEHGAFFDGLDDPELRKNGTGGMLDELRRLLERQAATA
ncbi:MAG TPA: SRPBCC domain-containing protein, partial [Candidatus Limnocylindrales bacterium]